MLEEGWSVTGTGDSEMKAVDGTGETATVCVGIPFVDSFVTKSVIVEFGESDGSEEVVDEMGWLVTAGSVMIEFVGNGKEDDDAEDDGCNNDLGVIVLVESSKAMIG